ncbi:PaaI family thioesterase [Aeromicrobium alkaliterrae]|uniref:Thioesterase domain-containing protein n=1 Tax=Aeromicrobium alkaliterrae TaxID=302168 RepID=A0ABP4VSH6_9ACTN
MTEPRWIDDVLEPVLNTPLHRTLGLRLRVPGDPSAGLELDVATGTATPTDVLHGGLHGLLIDVTAFLCLAAELPRGSHAATISSSISIVSAARLGSTVQTSARIDRLGGGMAFLSGQVESDGQVVATGQLVKIVKRP